MSRDITALKRAETEAKQAEHRLRRMLQHLPVSVAAVSLKADEGIFYRNDHFDRTFGWTPEDIPTHEAWFERAYPDADVRHEVIARWGAAIAAARAADGRIEPHEFRVTCRDGQVKDIAIGGTILDDRLICSFVDISKRKRHEAELLRAHDEVATANRALQVANAALRHRAVTDPLTGIWNRAYYAVPGQERGRNRVCLAACVPG